METKFYELDVEIISKVQSLIDRMALPFAISFKFQGHAKQKKAVDIKKVNDYYQYLTGYDVTIFINEDILNRLDDEAVEILIYQELDRIETDLNKGTVKIKAYPLQTTPGVLNRYGIDAVSRANELDQLINEQDEDVASDDISGVTTSETKHSETKHSETKHSGIHHSTKVEFLDD